MLAGYAVRYVVGWVEIKSSCGGASWTVARLDGIAVHASLAIEVLATRAVAARSGGSCHFACQTVCRGIFAGSTLLVARMAGLLYGIEEGAGSSAASRLDSSLDDVAYHSMWALIACLSAQ